MDRLEEKYTFLLCKIMSLQDQVQNLAQGASAMQMELQQERALRQQLQHEVLRLAAQTQGVPPYAPPLQPTAPELQDASTWSPAPPPTPPPPTVRPELSAPDASQAGLAATGPSVAPDTAVPCPAQHRTSGAGGASSLNVPQQVGFVRMMVQQATAESVYAKATTLLQQSPGLADDASVQEAFCAAACNRVADKPSDAALVAQLVSLVVSENAALQRRVVDDLYSRFKPGSRTEADEGQVGVMRASVALCSHLYLHRRAPSSALLASARLLLAQGTQVGFNTAADILSTGGVLLSQDRSAPGYHEVVCKKREVAQLHGWCHAPSEWCVGEAGLV